MAELNLSKRVESLDTSDKFSGYTGVIIKTGRQDDNGKDIFYQSTDYSEDGRVLELSNEWGSQAQADAIMADLKGKQYQPFEASGAIADPAFDIGDSVDVNGICSAVCVRATTFGSLMTFDVSAPHDEEIDHEYAYESSSNREYTRFKGETKASLRVTESEISAEVSERKKLAETIDDEINGENGVIADYTSRFQQTSKEISAKVSVTGGSSSSCSWSLTSDAWTVKANNSEVLKITASGLSLTGSADIINGSFTIKDSSGNDQFLVTNDGRLAIGWHPSEEEENGGYHNFYVDADGGLEINHGAFSVTSSGYVTASGTIKCDSLYVMKDGEYVNVENLSSLSAGISGGCDWSGSSTSVWSGVKSGNSAYGVTSSLLNDYNTSINVDNIHVAGTLYIEGHSLYLGTTKAGDQAVLWNY